MRDVSVVSYMLLMHANNNRSKASYVSRKHAKVLNVVLLAFESSTLIE